MVTVSVCMITYRHEAFIGQAIESVLMQQTDFAVELVIGEDCSPDATRAIAQDYERRYPTQVRVLTPATNLGIMPNLMVTMSECRGEYIAFLEGDDYWTDPTKLQRQVEALRANADCAMCFHDAEAFNDSPGGDVWKFSEKFTHLSPRNDGTLHRFTQLDLARLGRFMPSASMVFRAASLPKPLPGWFAGVFSGDYTLQLLSTSKGLALYLPRLMSAYRLHTGGVMQATAQSVYQMRRRIHENLVYKKLLPRSVHANANYLLSLFYLDLSAEEGKQGRRLQQAYYYFKGLTVDPVNFKRHLKRLTGKLVGAAGPAAA